MDVVVPYSWPGRRLGHSMQYQTEIEMAVVSQATSGMFIHRAWVSTVGQGGQGLEQFLSQVRSPGGSSVDPEGGWPT